MTRDVSRRTMLKALGAGGMMLAGGASMASAKSHKEVGELEILYEFEPFQGLPTEAPFGELPENVAIDKRGNKYVSVPSQVQIWKFSADNELIAKPFAQFKSAGEYLVGPTGVEVAPDGTLYSAFLGDFATQPADTTGVYRIDDDGEYELIAPITNGIQGFPSFPNDIALFGDSLLVTDSTNGVVWNVRKDEATVWAGELWDPTGPFPSGPLAPPAPGAIGPNGIQFSKNKKALYVANTGKGTIVEIPVENDGSSGEPTVFASGLGGPDGLAMDTNGYLYVADNGANAIVRISPDGMHSEVLASNADRDPVFNQPADVTFGTTGGEQTALFIVNLALNVPSPAPTFMKLDVGVPGLPVRR